MQPTFTQRGHNAKHKVKPTITCVINDKKKTTRHKTEPAEEGNTYNKLSGLHVAARVVGRPRVHKRRTDGNRTETESTYIHVCIYARIYMYKYIKENSSRGTFRGRKLDGAIFPLRSFTVSFLPAPSGKRHSSTFLSKRRCISLYPSVRPFVRPFVRFSLR